MSVITKVLKEKAVYWPPIAIGALSGDVTHDDFGKQAINCVASELSVRWEDMQEEVITPDGTTVIARSKVMVSADVELGGYLRLGELADLEMDENDPRELSDAFEIIKFDKIPNFRYTEFLRVAYL